MTTKHKAKTGFALLFAAAGLAWWYVRRITRSTNTFNTKQGKTRQAYGMMAARSRRGNGARNKKKARSYARKA